MPKLTIEIDSGLRRAIDRIVRDGWYADDEAVVLEALRQFVEAKAYLGDSPPLLHRFAADALNASKPETALKFVSRGLTLLSTQELADLKLYQQLVELRVQILMILDRAEEALTTLEEAKERLPNSPVIEGWVRRLEKQKAKLESRETG
jgi:Arc/MetJ-type ribon-helix-helix transcriptional regulator